MMPLSGQLYRKRWVILRYTFLFAVAFVTVIIPLWLVLVNSWKSIGDASQLGVELPNEWALVENYTTVIQDGRIGQGLINTLVVVVPSIIAIVLFGGLASWVFARSKGRAVSLLYYMCIAGVLVPPAIVTSILVLRTFEGLGSQAQLILFYLGVFMSFGVFLITGFVKTIPIELEEAARIDGANSMIIFVRIILPLLSPVLITVSFILLVFMWNDFYYAFFFVRGRNQHTLMLGLFNFVSGVQYQIRWNLVFADVALVSLPLIALFALAQRRIVSGLLGASVHK
jgi:raffinose/stachyose/melibiose transport system permease protein